MELSSPRHCINLSSLIVAELEISLPTQTAEVVLIIMVVALAARTLHQLHPLPWEGGSREMRVHKNRFHELITFFQILYCDVAPSEKFVEEN